MKIVADSAIPWLDKLFSAHGEIVEFKGRSLDRSVLSGADLLLVRSTIKVDETLLSGTDVKMVASATVGSDHVDERALQGLGIHYAHAPGCNANAVSEYVVSAIAWHMQEGLLPETDSLSASIIGFGRIGSRVGQKLEALGCSVIINDPPLEQSCLSAHSNLQFAGLDQALQSDIICLHTPLTTSGEHPTRHLFGDAEFQSINSCALLINAGRGAVIDNAALLRALDRNDGLNVVLDVWENEPGIDFELFRKVRLGTAHLAGHSWRGKVMGTVMIYKQACEFFGWSAKQVNEDDFRVDLADVELVEGAGLYDAVRLCYDIAAESRELYERLSGLVPTAAQLEFDNIRRGYYRRPEFSDLGCRSSDTGLCDELARLGFKIL